MATLFHPKYVRIDPESGEKVTRRLGKWYGRYRDANGAVQCVPLCKDRAAAHAMLADLVRKAERQQAGLPDSAAEQLARTIQEHIEEFHNHLLAKARSEFHISETIRLITAFASKCRLNILAELQGAGTASEGYLADRKESGSSHRTIYTDLTAVRSFCRWLLSKKRLAKPTFQVKVVARQIGVIAAHEQTYLKTGHVVTCHWASSFGTGRLSGTSDCQKRNPLRSKGFGIVWH
jgi:hypothetical protein